MTNDEARERAWDEHYDGVLFAHRDTRAFCAGWAAAMAHVWQECGVPTEGGVYLRFSWSRETWEPVYVLMTDCLVWTHHFGEFQPVKETPANHWRRPHMPPPPEMETRREKIERMVSESKPMMPPRSNEPRPTDCPKCGGPLAPDDACEVCVLKDMQETAGQYGELVRKAFSPEEE